MKEFERVRIRGPLTAYAAGFAATLTEQGYAALSVRNQLRLVAHFSRWLESERIDVADLTRQSVDRYLRFRQRTRTCWRSIRGLTPLLTHLGHAAIVASYSPADTDLIARYRASLIERGLSPSIQHAYIVTARAFLGNRPPAGLRPADVTRFVRDAPRCHAGLLGALRAVLRFLFHSGETSQPLVLAVPCTPAWKRTSLPKALTGAERRAVLSACDRRTVRGRREHLVVLLMLRLGLRACEVAALTLDDIDWSKGEITIRGKGTTGRLPLPSEVGEAMVGYLRGSRPMTTERAVFLTRHAPIHGISAAGIVALAGEVLRRAGVEGGGHRLRHTAATSMLRAGASLTEIAQVLRHRDVSTTAMYAKVDQDRLRTVALPWPIVARAGTLARSMVHAWPGGDV